VFGVDIVMSCGLPVVFGGGGGGGDCSDYVFSLMKNLAGSSLH